MAQFNKDEEAINCILPTTIAKSGAPLQEGKAPFQIEREQLARTLNLSSNQVTSWFKNRRIKYKKQQEELSRNNIAATECSSDGTKVVNAFSKQVIAKQLSC